MSTARFFSFKINRATRRRPFGWTRAVEYGAIGLFALSFAHLGWTLLTPVSSAGDWQGRRVDMPDVNQRLTLFRTYDPFFPAPGTQPGTQTVTSLPIKLFGTRLNEGSGLGSAIIAAPDGTQSSFAVGDEIMPGVRLKSVAFDHVVITRGGVDENIYLDQSGGGDAAPQAAPLASSTGPAIMPGASDSSPIQPPPPDLAPAIGVGFGPRVVNGRVNGIAVTNNGPGFAAMGFRPGDVVTQVNGRAVTAEDVASLQQALVPGGRVQLTVERAGKNVALSVSVPTR